jgi:hypothetical protein
MRLCSVCGRPTPRDRLASDNRGVALRPPICRSCRDTARDAVKQDKARRVDGQWPPRECSACHQVTPASQLVFWKGKPGPRCKPCDNARKRRSEKDIDIGEREIDGAPDPEPAKHLLDQLRAARANGESWEQAWPDCLNYVLSCIGGGNARQDSKDRQEWSVALRDTEWAWWACWIGLGFTTVDPSLLADAA